MKKIIVMLAVLAFGALAFADDAAPPTTGATGDAMKSDTTKSDTTKTTTTTEKKTAKNKKKKAKKATTEDKGAM